MAKRVANPLAGYADPEEMPLASYGLLLAAYGLLFGGLLVRSTEGRLPDRIRPFDLLLIAVATHKLARLTARDWVTSPLRAAFATYRGPSGNAEIVDVPRGRGLRQAIGELLTCPYCLGPWAAASLFAGLAWRPRKTRLMAATFASVAASDALHHAYGALQAKHHELADRAELHVPASGRAAAAEQEEQTPERT